MGWYEREWKKTVGLRKGYVGWQAGVMEEGLAGVMGKGAAIGRKKSVSGWREEEGR